MGLAELFSSPTATYNGELVDKTLKLVEKAPKPEGYAYGAVSDAGTSYKLCRDCTYIFAILKCVLETSEQCFSFHLVGRSVVITNILHTFWIVFIT